MTIPPPLPRPLYGALLSLVVLWLLGAGIAWYGLGTLREATASQKQASVARDTARHQLEAHQHRERQLEEAGRLWQTLHHAGHTDGEDLPGWTALLQAARNELGLPELAAKFGSARRESGWIARPLHLRLRLRHEEDLSRLLQHIRRHAGALIALRACRVEATDDAPEISGLDAECDVEWLTIAQEPARP